MKVAVKISLVAAIAISNLSASEEAVLQQTIITASKTETLLENSAGNASVISKEDIKNKAAHSMGDVLSGQEGITVKPGKGLQDSSPLIVLRGVPAQKRTLLLVDGLQLNDPYSGSVSFSSALSPEDLERVEIVRGPFSSLYGSHAMGGVVNFITKMPTKRGYELSFEYGNPFEEGRASKNLMQSRVSVGDKVGDFAFKLSYSETKTDGYISDIATSSAAPAGTNGTVVTKSSSGSTLYVVGNKGYNAYQSNGIDMKAAYALSKIDELKFAFSKNFYHYEYNNPESFIKSNATGATLFSTGTLRESAFLSGLSDNTQYGGSVSWLHKFANAQIKTTYASNFSNTVYTTPGTTVATNRYGGPGTSNPGYRHFASLESVLTLPIGEDLVVLGAQYKLQDAQSSSYNLSDWKDYNTRTSRTSDVGGKEKNIALFGELQHELTKSLSATVGARWDWWRAYAGYTTNDTDPTKSKTFEAQNKFNTSPKATLIYKIDSEYTLKTGWGRAFRTPDTYVLYKDWVSGTGPTAVYYFANPGLKPETSETFDIGLEKKLSGGGLFKVYVYKTEIKNLITNKTTTDASLSASTNNRKDQVNAGKAETKGYEIAISKAVATNTSAYANYTRAYTKTLENDSTPAAVGKRLIDIPEHAFNTGVTYDNKRIYGSVNLKYNSKVYTNETNADQLSNVPQSYDLFAVVDTKVGYKVNKNTDVSLAITNLLDREYYSYYMTQGRAYFAKLNLKF